MKAFDINRPDCIMINETGAWQVDTGRVSITSGAVVIAAGAPLYGVQLIYKTGFERGAKFFGDAWERGYGNLEWRGLIPERLMPWYMHVDENGTNSFIGVMVQPGAFVGIRTGTNCVTIDIDTRSGGGPVDISTRNLEACAIVADFNTENMSAFEYQRMMLKKLCPVVKLAKQPVYGGNNWYYAYGKSSREEILADAKFISELSPNQENRPYMVIDDGWQLHHKEQGECCGGPWVGNEDYGDTASLAKEMAALGVKPGIWIRPLYMAEEPKPEWIIGKTRANWQIDPSIPEVIDHVRAIVRDLRSQGYQLIKHDFSTYDIFGHWGCEVNGKRIGAGKKLRYNDRTNAEIIRDLYRAIAEEAGEDCVIIGCNTVSHIAAGLFEIQRTGDDTSGRNWERTRYMGPNTLAMRMPQHRIFYDCDADCAPITPAVPWEKSKLWLDMLGRSGTPLFVSARPGTLNEEQLEALRSAFARAAVNVTPSEPLDWQDTTQPCIWKTEDGVAEYNLSAFYADDDGGVWWR